MEQNPIREIVRAEYFSGTHEPTITIKKHMVRFSAYCLHELPGVDYVLFVMYPTEKRLVIESCSPDVRDAIRWSSINPNNRKPKSITCKKFYRKLCELMGWSEDCRYALLGKISGHGDRAAIAFDLTSALVYRPDAEGKISRTPEYPMEWGGGFGISEEEHHNNPLVKRFSEDTELTPTDAPDFNVYGNHDNNTENGYE